MMKQNFIDKLNQYKYIIVYGGRHAASATAIYLECLRKDIRSEVLVAVTNKIWNPDKILGHKVHEIKELLSIKEDSIVLIAVRKYAADVERVLIEYGFADYIMMDYSLLRDKSVHYQMVIGDYQEDILNNLIDNEKVSDIQFAVFLGKFDRMLALEMQIVGHCNLNCKSCCVFSPLVKEEYMPLEQYKRDIKRLSELVAADKLEKFTLVGGEPLLHPQIIEFIEYFREYYPDTDLCIFTNLIELLNKDMTEFLECCQKNRIHIVYTRYPLKIDYDALERKFDEYGITYIVFNGKAEIKVFDRFVHSINGEYNKYLNFARCCGNNPQIKDGMVYPCSIAPSFYRFSDYFEKNIHVGLNDGVNLFECKSYEELRSKLCIPLEICRYCGFGDAVGNNKWEVSKKEIEEWT